MVAAHANINWPRRQWNFTEQQQEEGSVCGGGQMDTTWAYNTMAFHFITVKLVTANSTNSGSLPQINNANVFNVMLTENVKISDSGNLCFNVSLLQFIPGAQGVIYIAATSSESAVVFAPSSLDGQPVIVNSKMAVNLTTNANYTY
uniref:Copper acquisition factor BIM1-like domain-containing protein n=1 Tax=Moniliophthora roreri TaxID=221103 RepID=A0A0W0FQ34_MONRR